MLAITLLIIGAISYWITTLCAVTISAVLAIEYRVYSCSKIAGYFKIIRICSQIDEIISKFMVCTNLVREGNYIHQPKQKEVGKI